MPHTKTSRPCPEKQARAQQQEPPGLKHTPSPDHLSPHLQGSANDDGVVSLTLPLFVFGSLMDADILARVLGPERAGAVRPVAALLHGYRRQCAREDVFPILIADPHFVEDGDDRHHPPVQGQLLYGLTATDLDRIEYYEGAGYALRPLTVELAAGEVGADACPGADSPPEDAGSGCGERRRTGAQVFLSTGLFSDSGVAWDLGYWQQTAKRYALLLTDALMAHWGLTPKEDMEGPVWAAIEARCRDLLAEEDAVILSAR